MLPVDKSRVFRVSAFSAPPEPPVLPFSRRPSSTPAGAPARSTRALIVPADISPSPNGLMVALRLATSWFAFNAKACTCWSFLLLILAADLSLISSALRTLSPARLLPPFLSLSAACLEDRLERGGRLSFSRSAFAIATCQPTTKAVLPCVPRGSG